MNDKLMYISAPITTNNIAPSVDWKLKVWQSYQRMRYYVYKTLRTSIIHSPMSPKINYNIRFNIFNHSNILGSAATLGLFKQLVKGQYYYIQM